MVISVGERLDRVTLLRELGRGGMGAVYLADDHRLGKRCAVKVLHPHLTNDPTMVARFHNEARAAAAIAHPAIVQTYDIVELPGGLLCCMMDYVEGPTLSEFCKRRKEPLPSSLILWIIGPLCEAFDQLHALRIVHRDLKPDNVLVVYRGGQPFPRVLDFGIAKRTDEPGLTRPGVAPGTAAYMAPEQAKGGTVDRLCDVYSLGVMMYWMATGGHLPYEVSDGVMYFHQVSEPPVDPRRRFSGVSDLAAEVILTAIHPEAARRPRTIGALALMWSRCVVGNGTEPDGTAILRASAPGLLVVGNLDETLRAPGNRGGSRGSQAQVWRYEYGAPLGKGGMAEVVRATLRGANGFAVARAIKLILPEFAQSPEFVTMFHEEARIASLLNHRNIVRVLEHDVDPRDRLYLAMEFVDGIDLDKLRQSGPVPHAVTIFVLCEVLEALDYAHDLPPTSPLASNEEIVARGGARGIVHRDVSHHNVLVSWLADVLLSDFGIAKLRTRTSADGSKLIKGKAGYMSPEQAGAQSKLDGRSDLWAIGVMLWELLTDQALFDHDTFAQTISAVLWGEIPRPSVVCPDVPTDLEGIVMRLLERDLSKRFQTAREVIAALSACRAASRDGRAELARLLVARFPDRARPVSHLPPAAPSNRPQVEESSSPGQRVFGLPTPAAARASSTTGHANGESTRAPLAGTLRWPWIAAFGIALATVVVLVSVSGATRRATVAEALVNTPAAPMRAAVPSAPGTSPVRSASLSAPAMVKTSPVAEIPLDAGTMDRATPPNANGEVVGAVLSATAQPPRAPGAPGPTSPRASETEKHADEVPKLKSPEAPAPSKSPNRGADKRAELQQGELAIIVKPWAMVSINGRPAGQTPYVRKLPIGNYRIRLVNADAEKDETMTVTVSHDHTTNIERTWGDR